MITHHWSLVTFKCTALGHYREQESCPHKKFWGELQSLKCELTSHWSLVFPNYSATMPTTFKWNGSNAGVLLKAPSNGGENDFFFSYVHVNFRNRVVTVLINEALCSLYELGNVHWRPPLFHVAVFIKQSPCQQRIYSTVNRNARIMSDNKAAIVISSIYPRNGICSF